MTVDVHVIPHTHWDREWYFTTSRSRIYLMKNVMDILDTLETDERFHYFMLDAQASLLDDYLKWRPEDEKRIQRLVSAKRLIIGPWYTQTDQLVISGESIVRNLQYGIERCLHFGHVMKVGYVPDSFGQSAQMPQIYQGFGIKDTAFWRGVSDHMTNHTEFNWRGADGSEVFAVNLPFGYYYGGNIPEKEEDLKAFLAEKIGALQAKATTNHVYFPNGFDQAPIRKNLPDLLEQANTLDENNYKISSLEDYIAAVKKERTSFETLEGELIHAKHMRIHKSIFSTRADLKILNNRIENYIVNVMEPILTISYSLGHEYPHDTVRDIWYLMFENAAHDSIGGCNSDSTNKDVFYRYKQAKEIAENLVDLHMRLIAIRLQTEQEITLTLFNTLPEKRSEVIEVETFITERPFTLKDANGKVLSYTVKSKTDVTDYVLAQQISLNPSKDVYMPKKVYQAVLLIEAVDLPSVGYIQVNMVFDESSETAWEKAEGRVIENAYYRITANDNGSLEITDKQTGRTFAEQMIFEDNGDDGDSYNYSPPREDLYVSSKEIQADITTAKSGLQEELTINLSLKVPYDLTERANKTTSTDLPIVAKVALNKDDQLIRFDVHVDNHALDHRLRVLFDTGIASRVSLSDQQFGTIERPTELTQELEWWNNEHWEEKPITIEPMQSFVALREEEYGVSLFTDCVREYQITGENYSTIAYTLFRCFGKMGKENLLYRPGRASGEKIVDTPDAQLQGPLDFTFGVLYSTKAINEGLLAKIAKNYTTPVQCYERADFLNGRLIFSFRDEQEDLQSIYSLLHIETDGAVLSALKKEEHGTDLVIRLFNPYLERQTAASIYSSSLHHGETANLGETPEGHTLRELDGGLSVHPLKPCQVQTYIVKKK
ncbi:mannosylglycerate hydrolase [Bacillus sp. NPDC077027]|uniref:mannosylglycerate hydrolase n=1 Tax=Bacillus sp. NPDC077027 TaxID=3390548 RepID=UPI003D047FB4